MDNTERGRVDSVQYSLMLKDIPVLKFDVDGDTEAMRQGLAGIKENSVSAVNPHLLPYYIRSKQLTSTVLSDYLSYRVLASHRANAGKICKGSCSGFNGEVLIQEYNADTEARKGCYKHRYGRG